MSSVITRERALLPAVAFYLWGCVGTPVAAPLPPAQVAAQVQPLRESFDPHALQEDLLLIQPTFARAVLRSLPQLDGATPPPPEGDLIADKPDDEARPALESASVVYEPGDEANDAIADGSTELSTTVYRVQLLALSNESSARQLRAELEQSLNAAVYVQQRNQLYMIQAGDYSTRAGAESLLRRVNQLSSDYGDAYIVSVQRSAAPAVSPSADLPLATSEEAPGGLVEDENEEMVRTFGWRVLLDQFLSYEEADRLRRKAMARLSRSDIDVAFKAPWYKVEVGHYADENAAQAAAQEIKSRYPNALKVRSQILVPKKD